MADRQAISGARRRVVSGICTLFTVQFLASSGCADTNPPQRSTTLGSSQDSAIVLTADVPLRAWKYIVLHHTATQSGSVASIDASHRNRRDVAGNPWRGIGYHFLIGNGSGMPDGAIAPTFRWNEQATGAHAGIREFNEHGIGICLVGNFEAHAPTKAQIEAATGLVKKLRETFNMKPDQVLRHGDLKSTACPGKKFPLAEILSRPTEREALAARVQPARFTRVKESDMEEAVYVAAASRTKTNGADHSNDGEQ